VTGKRFAGTGLRAIEPVMQEMIGSAQSHIHLLAYLIRESALPLLELLGHALARQVRLTLVINKLSQQPDVVRDRLKLLGGQPGVEIADFDDPGGGQLHAKVLVADRKRAVVGSANWSWGGLIANHEIGLMLEGDLAWTLADLIERLR